MKILYSQCTSGVGYKKQYYKEATTETIRCHTRDKIAKHLSNTQTGYLMIAILNLHGNTWDFSYYLWQNGSLRMDWEDVYDFFLNQTKTSVS